MVRILYGVSGEGSGHATRSKVVIEHLQREHEVKVITYGRGYSLLKDQFNAEEVYGFNLIYGRKIKKGKTVMNNLTRLIKEFPETFRNIRRIMKTFKPDIIISDFEPISSLISFFSGIPLISIDNQHMLTNCKIEYPKKYRNNFFLSNFIVKAYLARADYFLITSFYHPEIIQSKKEKTFLFPPILGKGVLKLKPGNGNFILAYLTGKEDNEIFNELKKINEKVIIYGLNRDEKLGNIQLKKFSEKYFLNDLANCKFVIATAGLSLISEALHLKKPLLTIPIGDHFEQIANAYYLQKLGYGEFHEKLNEEKVLSFKQSIKNYKKKLEEYKREDNSKIFNKIDDLIEELKND
ncbi:MAG: hypothetical protein KKE23_03900 [Nanoarchaeota archaeon]|nr:hypothetical protein [Nanoarchaeota archaeon]